MQLQPEVPRSELIAFMIGITLISILILTAHFEFGWNP